jgi:hypothetical protein
MAITAWLAEGMYGSLDGAPLILRDTFFTYSTVYLHSNLGGNSRECRKFLDSFDLSPPYLFSVLRLLQVESPKNLDLFS